MVVHLRSWIGFLLVATSCGGDTSGPGGGASTSTDASSSSGPVATVVTPAPFGAPYETLSEWHLFADIAKQLPADRVVPYEVASPLFSDYTTKLRFVHVPEGSFITYADTDPWTMPVGTILVKTFSYPADLRKPLESLVLLETRLLYLEPDGWSVHTYVYDETGAEARRAVAGKTIPSSFVGYAGEPRTNAYGVPNTNECKECHQKSDVVGSLGLRTRQMNRDHDFGDGAENQIDHLASLGFFASAPAAQRETLPDPFGNDAIDARARSYLDANCAHCHSVGGSASQSSLLLDFASTAPGQPEANWGRCKIPTSAGGATCGHTFDVVPGAPDESIMICRTSSPDPQVRMPPLATKLIHEEGVALISGWIESLPASSCPPM